MHTGVLSGLLFSIMVMMGAVLMAANPVGADMGCFIIGTEVNGDNSVEYLGLGNC